MLVDRYPDQPQCSPFEASSSLAMPSIPKGGVLVRVSNLLFNRQIFQIIKFKSFNCYLEVFDIDKQDF